MDKQNLATPAQKRLMMELGLKNKVGLTKFEAMRQIENAFADGVTPHSWDNLPATEKQKAHIHDMSGFVWVGMTKGDANRFIQQLQQYHDESNDYKCAGCYEINPWNVESCNHCNRDIKKTRNIIKPNFKPSSYSWFKNFFYFDRSALIALIVFILLALPGLIIRLTQE